jgi:hypothetical protein
MNAQINSFHSDLWELSISNIPGATPDQMPLFERFIKSCNFPEIGFSLDETEQFQGYLLQTPIAHSYNRENLGILQLEFKIDEGFTNYVLLFNFLQAIRYGQGVDTKKVMDYNIKEISIILLDSIKRKTGRFKFTRCWPTGLSAIPLQYGIGDEALFTTTIVYNEVFYEPEIIPQCES